MTLCSPPSSLRHHNYRLLLVFESKPCTQQFLTDNSDQVQQIYYKISKCEMILKQFILHGILTCSCQTKTCTIIYGIYTKYNDILRAVTIYTYLQSSSNQQGLDSTHSQCTQLSFPSLEPDLGHSCRMLLNHLLCQYSLSLIHSVGYQVDHSRLKEDLK